MIVSVDVGATKTLVSQFNERGKPEEKIRFLTPEDPKLFVRELKQQLHRFKDISAISIGIPGSIRAGNITRCLNLPLWKNIPIADEIAAEFKSVPIFIENDARLAGLAEINALSQLPRIGLYLTVSTGIGGGLVSYGKLTHEAHEWGHMVLNHEGRWLEWEHFASGRAIVEHFGEIAANLKQPEQWHWIAEQIAAGLCALIPAIEPEVIVFGGGVGNFFDEFEQPLTRILKKRLPSFTNMPILSVAKHPEEAVLYGCYYYATHAINY